MTEPTNVYSLLNPDWVKDTDGVGYDNDFWKIVNFFELHSLCDGQSWKGHNLHDTYLWKIHPWTPSAYLKDKIINAIWNGDTPHLYMAKKRSLFQSKIYGKGLEEDFYLDTSFQRACYVISSKGKNNDSEIMSFFYHLRNAFAHGRYGFVPISEADYMLFLEDGSKVNDQFEVTARIAIKKSSLIAVIDVITAGPDDDPDYAYEIIESIRRGNNSKAKIIDDIDISEYIWKKESQKLKDTGCLAFEKKKWIIVEDGDSSDYE